MLFNNNHNNIINIIDRKLSKSIMLFKWKTNIIKNKTKRKLTKIKWIITIHLFLNQNQSKLKIIIYSVVVFLFSIAP